MPGTLYHLAFAEEVYSQLPKNLPIDKTNFMAGNLIPDLTIKGNKKASHYRKSASIKGFFVPELKDAKKSFLHLMIQLNLVCIAICTLIIILLRISLSHHLFGIMKIKW